MRRSTSAVLKVRSSPDAQRDAPSVEGPDTPKAVPERLRNMGRSFPLLLSDTAIEIDYIHTSKICAG